MHGRFFGRGRRRCGTAMMMVVIPFAFLTSGQEEG